MAEYIDREAFIDNERRVYCAACDWRKGSNGETIYEIGDAPCRSCGINEMLDAAEDFPATDVAPVVHGHWQRGEFGSFDCSACGMWCEDEGQTIVYPYCPNCGAKMDERSEDNG